MERNTHSAGREGFPPCTPLRGTFSLGSTLSVFTVLSFPREEACLRRSSEEPFCVCRQSGASCPPSFLHHLPSLLGLPPSPLAPCLQLTTRAGLPPPYVNLALNLPPPQVTPIRLIPRSVEKGSFLLHAACSLLNSR